MKKVFSLIGRSITITRNIIINLFFIISLLLSFSLFIKLQNAMEQLPSMPKSAALVLDLNGHIVEQKRPLELMEQINKNLAGADDATEIELSELIHAIEHAANNNAINSLVLDLHKLRKTPLSQLQEIASAISEFKKSNKPVIAMGDAYSQDQYYLASYADELYLNPAGAVLVTGFARQQLYLKTALEKLKVTPHVFRVGEYKSAVEPFIRDDMSEQARADAQRWLNKLWSSYVEDVAKQRNISQDKVAPKLEQFQQRLSKAQGDPAQYALENGLVDKLLTRPQQLDKLQTIAGLSETGQSFAAISYSDYIQLIPPVYQPKHSPESAPKEQQTEQQAQATQSYVALITAEGTIVDGQQSAGTIGGDSLAKQLRKVRFNDEIKALVLRINSPGGSAFASEIIRNEIQAIKAVNKPVVISMGNYAASGGYWIAADADSIFAHSTTITGSIGIFGLFPTFENALNHFGVSTDGVQTGPLAGIGVTQALPEHVSQAIQLSIENGYNKFINVVANGRKMTQSQVEALAQGRIWTGEEAKDLGLVDEIGGINEALNKAVELAQLNDYEIMPIRKRLSPQEQMLMNLFGNSLAEMELQQSTPLAQFIQSLDAELDTWSHFNDPKGQYALCSLCQ